MADRRPVRLVLTEDRDLTAVRPGPAPRKVFKDVDDSFRQSLAGDLDVIEKRFSSQLTTQNLPVVATATLEGDALAKSHRPETLFNSMTCPIIGSDAIGSLRLSVTSDGLRSLRRQVLQGKTQAIEADLSTLIEIRPFEPSIAPLIDTKLNNPEKRGRPFKLKIFNHHDGAKNDRITRSLAELLDRQVELKQVTYSDEMIGSVAHKSNNRTLSRPGEPSPFSRRGPGVAFMPKPEVCHYGGNCDSSFNYAQTGVVSTTGNGALVESIGTSFSTPLIATLASGAMSATQGDALSINMTKALIVHSAALRSRKTKAAELRYKGFGVPGSLRELLECEPHRATLLFEPEIPSNRRIFSKLDFPIPDCFRTDDGKLRGGFMLTAVYDPPLSEEGGYDYCRANVEVSLGSFDPANPGEEASHSKLVSFHPKDYSQLGERHLIEQGFKWSPVKVFQDEFRGRAADQVRLRVQLYMRDRNFDAITQSVAIIATLYDPGKTLPVYDQTVQVLQATGWQTIPIELRQEIRERIQ